MAFNKTIEVINVGPAVTVSTGKNPYQTIELAFKADGKVEGKKFVSFNNENVFKQIPTLKQGTSYEVSMEKDVKGYWQWIAISDALNGEVKSSGVNAVESVGNVNRGQTGRVTGSNYETPEERRVKQLNITRQFSVNAALKFFELTKAKPSFEELTNLAEDFVNFIYDSKSNQEVIDMDSDIPV